MFRYERSEPAESERKHTVRPRDVRRAAAPAEGIAPRGKERWRTLPDELVAALTEKRTVAQPEVRESAVAPSEAREAAAAAPEMREFPAHLAPMMIVKSPPHARVRAVGLGRFFPANTVHVTSANAVVAGDRCKLIETDHYHVHRATVNIEPLRRLDGAGRKALARLMADPTDSGAIRAFQNALEARPTQQLDGDTQVNRRVAARHNVFVSHSAGVQTGSNSTMKVHANYVVEETVIPLAELLAEDARLVVRFAEAMRAPGGGAETTAFCRLLLDAVDEVDDLTRLAQATDITQVHDTTLLSFFGIAHVTAASAVLIGQDNKLTERLEIDLPGIGRRGLLADLDDLRELYGFAVRPPAEITEPAAIPGPVDVPAKRTEPAERPPAEPTWVSPRGLWAAPPPPPTPTTPVEEPAPPPHRRRPSALPPWDNL